MIPGLVTKCPRCFSIIDDNAYLWTVSPNVPGQRRYADRVGAAYHGAPVDIGAMHEVRRPPGYHGPLPSSAMEASQALGGPAIEICPVCHFVLPTGWRSGQAICIAMAGARATGKSLYVAVLIKQLEQLCERLGVSMEPATPATANAYATIYERPLFEQRGLIPPTINLHTPDLPHSHLPIPPIPIISTLNNNIKQFAKLLYFFLPMNNFSFIISYLFF